MRSEPEPRGPIAPEAARAFFDAVQNAKASAAPFLLVAAGTPDAPRKLRQAGTYNERGFERVRVGRLSRAATITALAEPARRCGRPMSESAAAQLAEESQDYPYFIQLLGRAAWQSAVDAGDPGIGIEAAKRGNARRPFEGGGFLRRAVRRGLGGSN